MRSQLKVLSVLIAAFAIAVAAALPALGSADDVAHLASLHDRARSEHGLASLPRAADLSRDAQSHAESMAARGEISHSGRASDLDGWYALGENVGWASTVEEVFQLFMDSTSHRNNILDSTWDSIGLGVAAGEGGEAYVAVLFGDRAEAKAAAPPPSRKPAAKKPKTPERKRVPAPPVPTPSVRATPAATPEPVPVPPDAPERIAPPAPEVPPAPEPKDATRVIGLLLSVEREHQVPLPTEAAAIGDVSAGMARQRFSESEAERRREAEATQQGAAARSLGGVARCAWSC